MTTAAPLALPEYISIGDMLKATPSIDSGRRILYIEASNEGKDQQGEVVAAKALADAAPYYKRYGNIDIDHFTLIGAKAGIPDYPLYEIGRPVDVGQRGGGTFVKAEIFQGEGPAAERANQVWSSMTDITPPQRWYPSVGGKVLAKSVVRDERGEAAKTVIEGVRWINIGLSKTPVNQHVPECATIPFGVFAKAVGGEGEDLLKALTAGYGTDSAGFTGGAALRQQSLDPVIKDTTVGSYFDFRERMAAALRKGEAGANPNIQAMHRYAVDKLGMSHDQAAECIERFLTDLRSKVSARG